MNDRPIRKDIRLDGYDYSTNGAYFVTICTKDKMCIFWENNDKYAPLHSDSAGPDVGAHSVRPQMAEHPVGAHSVRPQNGKNIHLSHIGWAVKRSFKTVSSYYKNVFFDRYVIMPNHIHVIIRIDARRSDFVNGGRTECAPTVSQVVKNLKENVTREIGFPIWQKSFYDRIIRNEREYRAYWQYIESNPENRESDELFSEE
ncbi:MAG: hypothetical protein Q4A05_00510 [Ruminococcus sp.]|nr:hypothetical protein [Ruminococcus sp.]